VVSTPLKNISQNGNLPQVGVENKKYWKTPPSYSYFPISTSQFMAKVRYKCYNHHPQTIDD